MVDILVILNAQGGIVPLEPYSVHSVGAAKAVSWAIGHNPGQVATLTGDTRMAQSSQQAGAHLPTSEGRQAESTPPSINSTAKQDLNSGP